MLSSLPPDITLYLLSFLSLTDVVKLHALSRDFSDFLAANEATIYHQLAILHHFTAPGVALEDAVEREQAVGGLLDGVTTWKQLCTFMVTPTMPRKLIYLRSTLGDPTASLVWLWSCARRWILSVRRRSGQLPCRRTRSHHPYAYACGPRLR